MSKTGRAFVSGDGFDQFCAQCGTAYIRGKWHLPEAGPCPGHKKQEWDRLESSKEDDRAFNPQSCRLSDTQRNEVLETFMTPSRALGQQPQGPAQGLSAPGSELRSRLLCRCCCRPCGLTGCRMEADGSWAAAAAAISASHSIEQTPPSTPPWMLPSMATACKAQDYG